MYKIVFIMLAVLGSATSYASEITVWSSNYVNSCGYFSNLSSDMIVDYTNYDVDQTSKIELHFGFNGTELGNDEDLVWVDTQTVLADTQDRAHRQFIITKILTNRGSARALRSFVFAFKITTPQGKVFWDKGSNTQMGYYSATLWEVDSHVECISDNMRPMLLKTTVNKILKD